MSLDYLIELLNKARVNSVKLIFIDREPRIEIRYNGKFKSSYPTTSYHGRDILTFEYFYNIKKAGLPEKARKNFRYIEKKVEKKLKSANHS